MNLLVLVGILIVLVKCFKANDSANKLTIIVGDNEDVPFNAYLPEGFHDIQGFDGYFVELNKPTGCKTDLRIQHLKEDEVNVNTYVTYIDWYSSTADLCQYDDMVGNLRNISIHHFVLVVDRNANSGFTGIKEINELYFVMFDPIDKNAFDKFKSHVSQEGHLKRITVETNKESEQNTSIPMSSMAILFVTVAFVT